jgi:hypothetical protein
MAKALVLVALACLLAPTRVWAAESCDYAGMKGEEITFKQTYPGGETYGYQSWYSKPDMGARHLAYKPYVGRKGKVTDGVIEGKYGISKYKRVVLENCETVYAHLVGGDMPTNVYSSLDFDLGKQLIGKQIWINQTEVLRPQTLATLERDVSYPLGHLEPVTVTGLYLASIGHAYGSGPFFLKVKKASDEEGYIAFNTMYFHLSDPIPASTAAKIAEAIRGQKVVLGMTAEQVELSWGKPEDVNRSVGSWGVHEQWVYGRQYVYLEDGTVSSFQD